VLKNEQELLEFKKLIFDEVIRELYAIKDQPELVGCDVFSQHDNSINEAIETIKAMK
jgi:hypothetical protein